MTSKKEERWFRITLEFLYKGQYYYKDYLPDDLTGVLKVLADNPEGKLFTAAEFVNAVELPATDKIQEYLNRKKWNPHRVW